MGKRMFTNKGLFCWLGVLILVNAAALAFVASNASKAHDTK
jgi:hypothetical protein